MNFIKILTLFIFFSPFSSLANSGLTITSWQEKIGLIKSGKISETLIDGKIELPQNQSMSSFSLSFDLKQNIKINKVLSDGAPTQYSFNNNALSVKFPKGKRNGELISIYFSYQEDYGEINKFLRQEIIYIPSFAAGAKAKVAIWFPWYLESATLNPNVSKIENGFLYNNLVPKEGVMEVIKLTPSQGIWDVNIKLTASSDKPLGKFSIKLPLYFQNYRQKTENYRIAPSIMAVNQKTENNTNILDFNTNLSEVIIENKAKIYTGKASRLNAMLNPDDYKFIAAKEIVMLTPILEKIKQDQKYKNFPLYAKIGKFVNEFIRYDVSYIDKLPSVEEILKNPVGVCTEYAKLYSALTRVAGIPSLIIDGGACGKAEKCEGHSWNMIYQNNKWIEVDPTWDLMSGIVSSSHVYFVDGDKQNVEIQYVKDQKTMNLDIDFKMINLAPSDFNTK